MTDGVRQEYNDRHLLKTLDEKETIEGADYEEGDRIYGAEKFPGNFWNWVIAGAGALLSLGIATTCLHCCAKSKNQIEAKHNVVGAELAGMLTEKGKVGPHGVFISQEDRGFGPPGGFTGNPYVQPMRNPPLSQSPMIHPPMSQPPINQPPMRMPHNQPSMHQR